MSWTALPANLEVKILDVTGLIHQKANVLRAQEPVNWLPYLDAGLINQSDYSFMTSFQLTKTKEERDELLDYFKDEAFRSLVHVVRRVCIVEEIQKFLVLIDDMLWEDISRVHRFNPEETEPWKAFLDLLSCADDFVRNISSRIIAKFISTGSGRPKLSDLKYYLNWLKEELHINNQYLLSVARCLQRLLHVDEYRLSFANINGVFRIIRLLCIGIKPQAQYQLVFCLWISSFNSQIAEKMNNYGIIPVLVDLLECAPSEITKLPRIIVATLRNLLETPREEGVKMHNALVMIQCKMIKYLDFLKAKKNSCGDPEYLDDCLAIEDALVKYVAELSTYDEYSLEVKSLRLEWSVVHTCKPFWIENAARLNENMYELLKILIFLLRTSTDTVVLCVAAHDLGEYMSHYVRGKKVVEELGGKDVLLGLLSNKHPVVKYHALKSLQILMLNNYDILIKYVSSNSTFDAGKAWSSGEKLDL